MYARFSTLALIRLASQPDSIIAASSACERQALHASFKTLTLSRLASEPDSIIAASSTCKVQHPRLESSGFSAQLHCSVKLRMRVFPLSQSSWFPCARTIDEPFSTLHPVIVKLLSSKKVIPAAALLPTIFQHLCFLALGNGLATQPLPVALPRIHQHLCCLALDNSLTA
ncbi:unnamed protein product [Lactuca saligna]|uniref:Uncharacterized protein n=1 Tax=Lactuca saligna TaxID=75948 RepID=A0AA36A1B4_LACSI|nr:unnamed protein product [Lactuca saligna]